ncbi:nucleoside hydrolase-like domain-containing protein [Parapedobacter sp. DT-150]|uniref:nucleoside hydrolase-like domain-containing protein n=1 Tax=Parapedobacter sp. DT-150 TaxID=3396162 RepID=UPI003F19B98D
MNMKSIFLMFCSLALVSQARPQSASISGVVKDKSTQLPVGEAAVQLLKRGQKTKTDKKGKFTIRIPKLARSPTDTLLVIDSRYCSQRIGFPLSKSTDVEIKLSAAKNRLIVTTDLGGVDPDDEQSMVHLLVGADAFDLEGLVVGLAWLKADQNQPGIKPLGAIIDAYEKVYPNLSVHADGYPTAAYLRSIVAVGQALPNMSGVGDNKGSAGSELIIRMVDKNDPRPVWLNAWGGSNTIAQALWTVKTTRTEAELAKFIKKIRVFDILGQDDAGAWIAKTFPGLIYIRAKSIYGWAPSDEWVKTHIQSHGPLGAVYPNRRWATEGDSPAFLHVWAHGLNDPDALDQGGWGGRFNTKKTSDIRVMDITARTPGFDEKRYDPYYMFTNTSEGTAAINKWKQHIYNNLQARMDWSVTPNYADANHHPMAVLNGDRTKQSIETTATAGTSIQLNATGSSDPDGDVISYKWYLYDAPSSYNGAVSIQNSTSAWAQLEIPKDSGGKTFHIILEVQDNGTPNLVSYRRFIVHVKPASEIPGSGQ